MVYLGIFADGVGAQSDVRIIVLDLLQTPKCLYEMIL